MKTTIFSTALLFLLGSTASNANLRAPINIPQSPSSALYPMTKDVSVLQEKMTVACDFQTCEVDVNYQIEVNKPISASVDFIVPSEVEVSAKIGQNPVAVQKKAVPYSKDLREQDREIELFYDKQNDGIYKASFPLAVGKGKYDLVIHYQQPLSLEERGYGYFSDGYYVGVFQYELWPLNEWQVSKDFVLDLNINLKPEAVGSWWDRLFDEPTIDCFTATFNRCEASQNSAKPLCKTVKKLAAVKGGDNRGITEKIPAPLPDRLFCRISPK